MSRFVGFCELDGDALVFWHVAKNASRLPVHADALPAYRVYGPNGLVTGQTGSSAAGETGTVTGATNANPIVITSAGHGLTTGQRVKVSGVLGNTAANTTTTVTRIDDNTFSLDSVAGNGTYTSGGAWATAGLYKVTITPSTVNGYETGVTYTVLVNYALSGTVYSDEFTFTVG